MSVAWHTDIGSLSSGCVAISNLSAVHATRIIANGEVYCEHAGV